MASTILVRSVIEQASALLQDTAPQFAGQPEREMVDWLNEGQLFIAKFLPLASSRIDSIKLKAGSLQSIESIAVIDIIAGSGVAPTVPVLGMQLLRLICNMGADGLTAGKGVRITTVDAKDSQTPAWRAIAKSFVDEYVHDPSTPVYFEVSPAVVGNVWVRAAFNAQPANVPNTGTPGAELYAASGVNATRISLSDEFAQDLVNIIVARSNMRDTEWADGNKANAFSSMVLSSINAKVAAVTGHNPNLKSLPFAPQPIGQAS